MEKGIAASLELRGFQSHLQKVELEKANRLPQGNADISSKENGQSRFVSLQVLSNLQNTCPSVHSGSPQCSLRGMHLKIKEKIAGIIPLHSRDRIYNI